MLQLDFTFSDFYFTNPCHIFPRDLENDPLTFSLVGHPVGMAIDSNGRIQWTPNTSAIGQHSVEVAVTDKQGAIATQTFTVNVGTDAINLPPAIISTPVFTAATGRAYSYQVTATDADGTIAQYQLLQSPPGMTINPNTGIITWNNPTAGNHQVVVGALDNSGTGAAQGFTLIARENAVAVVPQIPSQSASPGQTYRYNLRATDANGDLLTYTLVQSPSGMTVDEFGRISWQPTAAHIGNNPVEIRVTDTFGESVNVSYNLSVVADTTAPKVNLIASSDSVNIGESVTFTVTAITDANGKTTQFEYDAKGQLKAVVDAAQKRTEYTYNAAGNLVTVKDALGQVTTYEYDDKGRRKAVIRPDTKRSTVAYNDAEKTVTITDFNNKTVKYTYNDKNEVIAKQYQNESGATVSVSYVANGSEETITDSRGATVYKYDDLGQLISRKDPTGPYLASGNSIEYKYESGQVSEVKTPTRTTNYTYYTEGDLSGRLKTVSTPDLGTVTYVYYPDGNLWKTLYPNNLVETRTYDSLGRLDLLKTAKVDPVTQQELQVVSSFDYAVDNLGNRKEVLENSGRKVEYKYDDLHRLLEEKVTNDPNGNNRVVTYSYDAVGNRLTQTDSVAGVTNYTYNGLNQLDFLTNNGVVTDYSYDSNGNLISEVTGNNSTVYRWENDSENRLVGVTVTEGGVTRNVAYKYNAQGMRVSKVIDGVETRFLIDELQPYDRVMEEYDALGNAKGSYVYGYDLLGKLQGNQPSFYHADGLGSTRLLTNGLGGVTDSYAYDAYGNLIVAAGGSSNAYLFAGEQRDGETGLDYLRARYYDPSVGRFVSADAYEGSLDDPMSLHDYQYAHANPVVNTDPSGYFSIGELLGTMAGYSVLAGLSYTTGAAVGTVAGGGSVWDAVAKYDQFFAGLADSLTFGISSEARRFAYGETATANHKGIFFNLGRLGGAVASMWIGAKGTTFAEFSSASWVGRAALGYDLFGTGIGMVEGTRNIMEGRATWWDILAFLPLLTWFNTHYKVAAKGLGINGGNLNITPRGEGNLSGFRIISNKLNDADAGLFRPKNLEGVSIKDGKLFIKNQALHNPNHMDVEFVVGLNGNLVLGRRHQHLAKVAGDSTQVLAAGRMNVKNGKITIVDNGSGHFLPTEEEVLGNYPQLLRNLGLDLKGTKLQIWVVDESHRDGARIAQEIILE